MDWEVETSIRRYKRALVKELASEAEQAAANGERSTEDNIERQLYVQGTNQSMPVKDKQGTTTPAEMEQA